MLMVHTKMISKAKLEFVYICLHSGKLNAFHPEMHIDEAFLFQGVVCRFHAKFLGCTNRGKTQHYIIEYNTKMRPTRDTTLGTLFPSKNLVENIEDVEFTRGDISY